MTIINFTGKMIADLIENHKPRRAKMVQLYNNYKGKSLAIMNKEVSETSKANNKIRSNYRGLIVDQKNGYLMGNPINFSLDSLNYQENLYPVYDNELKKFLARNRSEDVFAETEKLSSIAGYSAWICYYDKEAKERFTELNPWDVIIVEDDRIGSRYGIHYYPLTLTNAKGEAEVRTVAEAYDDEFVYFFIAEQDGNFKAFTPDGEADVFRKHNYFKCPLIKIRNNEEEIGDFERVEDYIEKYEFTISTVQDEIDQFRLAYMLITGAELTSADLEKIKATGAFSGLEPEDRVEFITKNINGSFLENHIKTLNDDIYKHSATIDYNNEGFSGSGESGESRKWKLIALENKAKIKERKMDKALRDLFEVICSSWINLKGINVDYLDIYFTFQRNIPVDLQYLADVAQKLKGMVSEETRLSALGGLVDDVEWEKQKMAEEATNSISLDSYTQEIINPSGTNGAE